MDATTFPEVVKLNVGGRFMTTFLSTLTKESESMLSAMFSGRHEISKDEDGRFFIDCDGNLFDYILNYLRFGTLPPKEKALEIYDIALYFNVQSLVNSLERNRAVQYRNRIVELKTSLEMQEYNRLKQDAEEQLYKCCARLEDGIIILFIPSNAMCSVKCSGQIQLNNSPYNIIVKHTIILRTRDKKMKDMKLCVAHDLNELGFGKYIYADNKSAEYFCFRCQNFDQTNDTVLLVAYKIIESRKVGDTVPSTFCFV